MRFSLVKHHYVLWIKKACPWCTKAKDLLQEKDLSHNVFVMDEELENLGRVKERHNWNTVPIVFEITPQGAFNFIGGYTDLEKHLGGSNENNSMQTRSDEETSSPSE